MDEESKRVLNQLGVSDEDIRDLVDNIEAFAYFVREARPQFALALQDAQEHGIGVVVMEPNGAVTRVDPEGDEDLEQHEIGVFDAEPSPSVH